MGIQTYMFDTNIHIGIMLIKVIRIRCAHQWLTLLLNLYLYINLKADPNVSYFSAASES